jgi:hypothetical protein
MARSEDESSRAFFQRLRPRFLDWEPPTAEEKALEVKARQDAKEAELKKVTDLAHARAEEKAALRKRRSASKARAKIPRG